jgi:hypothetical protein
MTGMYCADTSADIWKVRIRGLISLFSFMILLISDEENEQNIQHIIKSSKIHLQHNPKDKAPLRILPAVFSRFLISFGESISRYTMYGRYLKEWQRVVLIQKELYFVSAQSVV